MSNHILAPSMGRRTFLKLSAALTAAVSVPGLATAGPRELKTAMAEKWVPTVCKGCNGRCATAVRVIGGVAVKVEGLNSQQPGPAGNMLSTDPVYNGKICAKGAAALEQMYSPDRIKYPMIRVGKRGSGRWKRISWTDAYNRIVTGDDNEGINWKGLRDHHGKWNPLAGMYTADGPADGPNPADRLKRYPETMVNAYGRHQADWYQSPWLHSYGHYPYRYQR